MNEDERLEPTLDRMTGAGLGFFVGLGATPLIGPILGPLIGSMSAPILEEVSYLFRRLIQRRRWRVELAVDVGCQTVELSPEELAARALNDDRRVELLVRALEAAATSEDERKVRALGRAMALGVVASDDAEVDEYLRIVSTLSQLEPIDARILETMSAPDSKWMKRPGGSAPAIVDDVPGAESVVDAVFARLSSLGLITDSSSEHGIILGGAPWKITTFGQLCMDALLMIGKEETASTKAADESDDEKETPSQG